MLTKKQDFILKEMYNKLSLWQCEFERTQLKNTLRRNQFRVLSKCWGFYTVILQSLKVTKIHTNIIDNYN